MPGFLLVNFGFMTLVYVVYFHLFHLIANSDFGLFAVFFIQKLFQLLPRCYFIQTVNESLACFLKCPPVLSFKLNLIDRMTCRVWFLEVINIMCGLC